jgi:hypothetical protein
MTDCSHLWTYRSRRSECIRCGETANDERGLPHGHYAVNGEALTVGRLQAGYACQECTADINPRVVLGELRILCAGPGAHDVARAGRAIPKAKRDYLIERQRMDAVDALDGLKGVLDMPILDLQNDAEARLKRAGIIRLGHKEKSKRTGKEYPVEDAHFVLKDAPGLADVYGDEPRRLNIYLPFNEVDRNLIAWHQNWVAGGLVCRGDGQSIEYAIDCKTGEVIVKGGKALATGKPGGIKMSVGQSVRCAGMNHDLYPRCRQCRPGALLIVLIREIPRLAYYQITTNSIHNIVNLTGQMKWVKEHIGRLQGVPFILERRPDKISTPSGNGKRVRRKKYLLHLEPDPEWVKAVLADMARRSLPGGAMPVAAIPAEVTVEASAFDDEPMWEPPDYINGDFTDENASDNQTNDEQEQAQPNGKSTRPLEPSQLKAALLTKIANDTGEEVTGAQVGFLARKLQEIFSGESEPEQCYHSVLQGLWSVDSAKKLTKAQASATLDWLLDKGGPDDTGDTPLHEHAPEEARRVLRQAKMDAGQQELELEGNEA